VKEKESKKQVNVSGMCEKDHSVDELLKKGHSIDELIELFSDKEECHDLYVNSALVYPDFETIIAALKSYKERLEIQCESKISDEELKMLYPEPAYRLFVDMDGTLCKFIPQKNMDLFMKKDISVIYRHREMLWKP